MIQIILFQDLIALLHFRMKCLARFKKPKYDFITHQEFSMTKHFSFETNESRRHFMKLMASVGAGLAFSGTLGTFAPKAFAADI